MRRGRVADGPLRARDGQIAVGQDAQQVCQASACRLDLGAALGQDHRRVHQGLLSRPLAQPPNLPPAKRGAPGQRWPPATPCSPASPLTMPSAAFASVSAPGAKIITKPWCCWLGQRRTAPSWPRPWSVCWGSRTSRTTESNWCRPAGPQRRTSRQPASRWCQTRTGTKPMTTPWAVNPRRQEAQASPDVPRRRRPGRR
jgi:hypothetical protein